MEIPGSRTVVRLTSLMLAGWLASATGLPWAAMDEETARTPTALEPGRILEHLACLDDPSHTYALYLPSSYTPERRWPVLIALDPRGRAEIPLQLLKDAVEEHGWIVLSSYDSRSDGPRGPNAEALKALLPEAERRFSIDTERLYLTGFSGTARASWDFGLALAGHVAGLIGVGAGLPPGREVGDGPPFAYFGLAGETDFNYQEMRSLSRELQATPTAYRIRFFDGGHQWPPAEALAEAIGWMELQAMKSGLRPPSRPVVERLYERGLAAARALDEAGEEYEAWVRYRDLAADFGGLLAPVTAQNRAEELSKSGKVRHTMHRMDRIAIEETAFQEKFHRLLAELQAADPVPDPAGPIAELKIDALRQRELSEDRLEAQAAARMLQTIWVYTSFYETRRLLAAGDPARASLMTGIAAAVEPESPQICLNQARVRAQAGEVGPAVEALACALERGVPVALAASDPYLEPLRDDERYRRLVARPSSEGGR